MEKTEKTTKLTLVKNSLNNFFDPSLILENDYFRVRLIYKDIEVPDGVYDKHRFTIDAIVNNVLYQNYLPYISGTYENPVFQMHAATINMSMLPIFKEAIYAAYDTVTEIKKFLDANY